MAKYLHILGFLHVHKKTVFSDLFSIFSWLKLDVSLSKWFSRGSFLSQSDNSSSSSRPTFVIFFELIPSLVPDTWSKSWKYALNWGAYPLFLLLSFACLQVSFRFLILSVQCQIDFAGPAATTETFISAQTLWLLVLSVNLKFSFHELTNFGVWLLPQRCRLLWVSALADDADTSKLVGDTLLDTFSLNSGDWGNPW